MADSLFGHLAFTFGDHPENIATEALSFILGRSAKARLAFQRLLAQTGVSLPDEIRYVTQDSGDDEAIPDLVGYGPDNTPVVVAEAKFWAGLTDNQPITYLKRILDKPNGILLFIAPVARLETLWPELIRRCKQAKYIGLVQQLSSELLTMKLGQGIFLGITSWRLILNTLKHALETEGELETAADVRQLEGLREHMDTEAFLPLRSAELAGENGTRMLQFNGLVDDITQDLIDENIASVLGLRATPLYHGYGRYMKIGDYGCMLQVNANWWSTLRDTPIWFSIKSAKGGGPWKYSSQARERLSHLEFEEPTRLFVEDDLIFIPIFLPLGKERSEVLKEMRAQIDEVFGCLSD
jgi:hypothetical protein